MDEIRKTPVQWQDEDDLVILDPDGWDRENFEEDWARPITYEEYIEKRNSSTVGGINISRQRKEDKQLDEAREASLEGGE